MAISPATEYPGQTAGTSANYPEGEARNVTLSGDGTGTPWEKKFINDLFGFLQALLGQAGAVANGSEETALASQYMDSLKLVAGHPGIITPYGLNVDPATFGIRMLRCDGSGMLRANYPDLDAATYVGNTNNATADAFYRADDVVGAVRNTAGIYLILPDLRGRFIRGLDPSGTTDVDGPTAGPRVAGQQQLWATERHLHGIQKYIAGVPNASAFTVGTPAVVTPGTTAADFVQASVSLGASDVYASDNKMGADISFVTAGTQLVSANETRPLNASFNWGVWY
jgi:hypothetical protein